MSRVWDHSGQKGTFLLVLLAIADHTSDDGVAYPGIKRMAAKTKVSQRQLMRIITKLEEAGELFVDHQRGRGNTNWYFVAVGMSAYEIEETLRKRFGFSSQEAQALADRIIDTQNGGDFIKSQKGDIGVTFSKKPKKVTRKVKNVTPRAVKRDIAMSPESCNHQEEPLLIHEDSPKEAKPPTPAQQMYSALVEVLKWDQELMRGRLNKAGKELREAGRTGEAVMAFGDWWKINDWRGKQGQPPTLAQLKESWGQFEESQKQPAPLFPPVPDSPLPESVPLTPEELILEAFKERAAIEGIPAPQWREHIAPMKIAGCSGGRIQVEVNPFSKEILERRFNQVLDRIARELTEGGFEYVVT